MPTPDNISKAVERIETHLLDRVEELRNAAAWERHDRNSSAADRYDEAADLIQSQERRIAELTEALTHLMERADKHLNARTDGTWHRLAAAHKRAEEVLGKALSHNPSDAGETKD